MLEQRAMCLCARAVFQRCDECVYMCSVYVHYSVMSVGVCAVCMCSVISVCVQCFKGVMSVGEGPSYFLNIANPLTLCIPAHYDL